MINALDATSRDLADNTEQPAGSVFNGGVKTSDNPLNNDATSESYVVHCNHDYSYPGHCRCAVDASQNSRCD
jgi:hypothetical protein